MALRRNKVDKLPLHRRERNFPRWVIGIIAILLVVGFFLVGQNRHALSTDLASGKTVKAEFSRNYLLLPNQTKVKVAGVPVGVVTGEKHNGQGVLVTMKIFGNNRDKLGTDPSAEMRLIDLLGGLSYVQLTPGGASGHPTKTIPISEKVNGKTVQKTTVPVYLDSVLDTVTPNATSGALKFVQQSNDTFDKGGITDTKQLLANAPGALRPSKGVLDALQGDEPGDLTTLVQKLEATDATVTAQQGQVEQVVGGLGTFSQTLGDNAEALQTLAGTLPTDLANTRAGLTAVNTVLHEVQISADLARPSVQELGKLIDQSQPTLVAAHPVLQALNPLLANLDPVLSQLVPTSTQLTQFLSGLGGSNVNGSTINRLNTIVPQLTQSQNTKDEKSPSGQGPIDLIRAIGDTTSGLGGTAGGYDATGHYFPVIVGLSEFSIVPSHIDRKLNLQPTDACGNTVVGGKNTGLGPCPGGDATGDATTGGPLNITALPKHVDPPAVQP